MREAVEPWNGKRKKVFMQLLQPSISAVFKLSGKNATIGVLGILMPLNAAMTQAQTIQMPALQRRAVRATLVVPNRGTINLGGVAGTGQSRMRIASPFVSPLTPTRSLNNNRGVGNMQTSVWIHDLQAMDAAILAEGHALAATKHFNPRSNKLTNPKPRPRNRLPAGN